MGSQFSKYQYLTGNYYPSNGEYIDFPTFAKDAYAKLKDLNERLMSLTDNNENTHEILEKCNQLQKESDTLTLKFNEILQRIQALEEDRKADQDKYITKYEEIKGIVDENFSKQQKQIATLNNECKMIIEENCDKQQKQLDDFQLKLDHVNKCIEEIFERIDRIEVKVLDLAKPGQIIEEPMDLYKKLAELESKYTKIVLDLDSYKADTKNKGCIIEKFKLDVVDAQEKILVVMKELNDFSQAPKISRKRQKNKKYTPKKSQNEENISPNTRSNTKLKKLLSTPKFIQQSCFSNK